MLRKSCRPETLACSEVCAVEYCHGCGLFHVNLGPATLHFRPAAFRLLCATLNTALSRFGRFCQEESPQIVGQGEANDARH